MVCSPQKPPDKRDDKQAKKRRCIETTNNNKYMISSDILISAIKIFEGCRLFAYRDSVGVPTIGYGHTSGVKMGTAITQKQAEDYLREDLKKFENYVNKLAVCKTQGQFDALVDFAYNCGTGNLSKSTLLKYVRAGKSDKDIQAQFLRWNKAGGKVLAGLTKRRAWESQRWTQK